VTTCAVGSSGEGSESPVLRSVYDQAPYDGSPMVKKHNPTPEERDERVSVPLDPKKFIEGVLAVEPDEDDDGEDT
jgi:hypothetical protein